MRQNRTRLWDQKDLARSMHNYEEVVLNTEKAKAVFGESIKLYD